MPSSLQPTLAGLQKRTPTLQRSICTPTSRLSRAVHRCLPLSPPTASVPTSAPRTRMLGGSLCGRNWTRTEGAGETRLLPGSRHPPPHGHKLSAVTTSGLHSPRRLLGHCPQAHVPEAGVFPLCSSAEHWPEGRLWGSGRKPYAHATRTPHSETVWGMSCPPGRGSGVSLRGWVDTRYGLFSSVLGSDFHLTLCTRPLLVSPRHRTGGQPPRTQKAGHVACVQLQTNPVLTCGVTAWPAHQRFLNISTFVGVHEYFINLI